MCIRKDIKVDERRRIKHPLELNSRVSSTDIPESLQKLEIEYPSQNLPVDICLATNMISVGIDVSRLGFNGSSWTAQNHV